MDNLKNGPLRKPLRHRVKSQPNLKAPSQDCPVR